MDNRIEPDMKELPEVGSIYHPTVGGEDGRRGRKIRSRKVVACRQIDFMWYVDIILIGSKSEEQQTIRLLSFRFWIRRVAASVEKPVIITEETPYKEQVKATTQPQTNEKIDGFSPEMVAATLKAQLEERKMLKGQPQEPPSKQKVGYQSPWNPPKSYFEIPGPTVALPPVVNNKENNVPVSPTEQPVTIHDKSPDERRISGFMGPDDIFSPQDKVAIFFDGANFEESLLKLIEKGYIQDTPRLNYAALAQLVRRKCHLGRIYYYAGAIFDRPEHQKMQRRLDWMEYNGITVKIRQGQRSYENEIIKSNVDVILALDMYRIAQTDINHIVLFSGDCDYVYPIELIKDCNVRVTVVGSRVVKTLSDKLRRVADQVVELKDFVEYLA